LGTDERQCLPFEGAVRYLFAEYEQERKRAHRDADSSISWTQMKDGENHIVVVELDTPFADAVVGSCTTPAGLLTSGSPHGRFR
jgi:hypothetical protein